MARKLMNQGRLSMATKTNPKVIGAFALGAIGLIKRQVSE